MASRYPANATSRRSDGTRSVSSAADAGRYRSLVSPNSAVNSHSPGRPSTWDSTRGGHRRGEHRDCDGVATADPVGQVPADHRGPQPADPVCGGHAPGGWRRVAPIDQVENQEHRDEGPEPVDERPGEQPPHGAGGGPPAPAEAPPGGAHAPRDPP